MERSIELRPRDNYRHSALSHGSFVRETQAIPTLTKLYPLIVHHICIIISLHICIRIHLIENFLKIRSQGLHSLPLLGTYTPAYVHSASLMISHSYSFPPRSNADQNPNVQATSQRYTIATLKLLKPLIKPSSPRFLENSLTARASREPNVVGTPYGFPILGWG